jgi:hypothetical protein
MGAHFSVCLDFESGFISYSGWHPRLRFIWANQRKDVGHVEFLLDVVLTIHLLFEDWAESYRINSSSGGALVVVGGNYCSFRVAAHLSNWIQTIRL